jgi:hypothetical protein
MKRITIELSPSSCQKAIEELKRYEREIRPKLDEVCRRLAEIGVMEAQAHLVLADGNTDATILQPVKTENGYKIVMQGEDVYFIEFGTGNSAGMFYGDGLPATSVPIYPGSYSETHSGMYAKWGYWFYQGEIMSSTDVYMPMYYAGKKMREEMPRVVKEVFG